MDIFSRRAKEQHKEIWQREQAEREQRKQLARIARKESGSIIGNPDVAPLYDESTEAGRALMERARNSGGVLRVATGARDVRDWKQRGDALEWFAVFLLTVTIVFYGALAVYMKQTADNQVRAAFVQPLVAAHRGEVSPCQNSY